jgi:putative hydrolase of the HAD superfamily
MNNNLNLRDSGSAQDKDIISNGIEAVLFDLGNVVVRFDHRIAARKIGKFSSLPAEKIYDLFFDSPLVQSFEEGRVSSAEFFERIKDMLSLNIGYEEFVPIWNEIFFENPGIEEIIGRLKKRFKIFLISNVNQLHFDYIRNRFDILGEFEKFILSYQVGARKPDRKIYEMAIKETGLAAEKILYTDDRLELIEAGRSLGLGAIHFKGVKEFNEELRRLNLISQP